MRRSAVILGFFVISTATRLQRGEKAGILLIFILGLVTIIAAVFRFSLQYTVHKKVGKEGITGTSGWYMVHSARTEMFLMASSVVEMNIALVAVSVPPFRVFLRRGSGRGNATGRTSPTGGLLESHDAWGRLCSTGTTQGYSQSRGKSDLEELQEMVMRPVTPELVMFEENGNGSERYGDGRNSGLPNVRLTETRQ